MTIDPKTIRGQIECLARLTNAPESFVDQVRALFLNKGISLDAEASPYLAALEEAFRREETIRLTTRRARESIVQLQEQFSRLGEAYRRQLGQLKTTRGSRNRSTDPSGSSRASGTKSRALLASNRRSVVTRTQRDKLAMVPGPEETQ